MPALNILEPLDLRAMSYNTTRYIHTLYQAMNLAFADRDFITAIRTSYRPNPFAVCSQRNTRANEQS